MPSAPTQAVKDEVTALFPGNGVPTAMADSFFTAIDQAGYTLVAKADGTPAPVLDSATVERVLLPGIQNAYLCGVRLAGRGWLVWREDRDPVSGRVSRDQSVYVSGDQASLL